MRGIGGRRGEKSGIRIARWSVRLGFLIFFVLLAFKAAYPPLASPPANIMLRFDPLAGIYSLLTARSVSALARFWPAWVLLGLTALSSRFFCGWICPLGTCFDAAGALKPRALRYYEPGGKLMKKLLAQEEAGSRPRRIRMKYLLLALVLALGLLDMNLFYFASPLVVMNRSAYYVLVLQVPVLLLILLLLAFVYRPRFWCNELCPMGALMSLVSMAGKRLSASLSPLSLVKDAGSCIDCGACFRSCEFGVAEPFIKRESGRLLSADCTACGDCVAACPASGALTLETVGVPLLASKGANAARGTLRRHAVAQALTEGEPGEAIPAPGGSMKKDSRFTLDRREFIGSLSLGAILLAGYGIGLREVAGPVLRMPGAQDEPKFLAACSRCGECARTCPAGCIKPMGVEDGFEKLWTPRFHPRTAGCLFDQCDQACERVCPMKAIERQKAKDVKIGLAQVDKRRCLGWRGQPCLVCKERCRFNAVDADGLKPVVVAHKCTGCGACEQTCPTEPASIRVFNIGQKAVWALGNSGEARGRGGRGQT